MHAPPACPPSPIPRPTSPCPCGCRRLRALRTPRPPPPPGVWASLGWARWRERRAAEPTPWFIAERRAAEARLVRAHASKLRRMAQRHSARLRDRQMARDAAGPTREAPSAVSPGTEAADCRRPDTVEPPPDAHAPTRIPRGPPGGATIINIGAGRPTIPPPGARKDGTANGCADSDPALPRVFGNDGHAAAFALAQHVDGSLDSGALAAQPPVQIVDARDLLAGEAQDEIARPHAGARSGSAVGDLRGQHAGAERPIERAAEAGFDRHGLRGDAEPRALDPPVAHQPQCHVRRGVDPDREADALRRPDHRRVDA